VHPLFCAEMPRRRRALGDVSTIRTACLSALQVLLLLLLLATAASVNGSVLEFLECSIACGDVQRFIEADARVWGAFLSAQPGFIRKQVLLNPRDAAQLANGEGFYLPSAATNCSVSVSILWESRALWKSISPQLLSAASARFVADFGYQPALTAHPSGDGYDVAAEFPVAADAACSRVPAAVIVGAAAGSVAVLAAVVSRTASSHAPSAAAARRHTPRIVQRRRHARSFHVTCRWLRISNSSAQRVLPPIRRVRMQELFARQS
jgi:hypothetical protein